MGVAELFSEGQATGFCAAYSLPSNFLKLFSLPELFHYILTGTILYLLLFFLNFFFSAAIAGPASVLFMS